MKTFKCILCAMLFSLLSGLTACCGITVLAALISPYYRGHYPRFVPFCLFAAIFAVAAIVALVILNYKLIIKTGKIPLVFVAEFIVFLVTFFPAWIMWENALTLLQKVF